MADIEEQIEQIAAGIADEVTSYLKESLGPLVDELVRERLSGIVAQLAGATTSPKAPRAVAKPKRPSKPSKPPKVASNYGPKCGKCGRTGHNARTCGKAADSDDDDEEEPAPRIQTLIERSSIGQGLKNIRENGIDAEIADLERRPRRDDKPSQPRPPRTIDTTTVAVGSREVCPHGNGSHSTCSQCVLAGVKVTRVEIRGGNVVVDGAVTTTLREHAAAARPYQATRGAEIQRARKAKKAA